MINKRINMGKGIEIKKEKRNTQINRENQNITHTWSVTVQMPNNQLYTCAQMAILAHQYMALPTK